MQELMCSVLLMGAREVAHMQQAIQFETIIESGVIRIPEQFIKAVSSAVIVTLAPVSDTRIKTGAKSKAGALSPGAFSAIKIDLRGWKFDRDEANERL